MPVTMLRSSLNTPHTYCTACNAICPDDQPTCTHCWSTALIPGDLAERTARVDTTWLDELIARTVHLHGIEPHPRTVIEHAIPQILDAARNGLAEIIRDEAPTW